MSITPHAHAEPGAPAREPSRTDAHARAAAREIEARDAVHAIPEHTPRYWFDGDPFMTHLMNALSLTVPELERFFVTTVRALRRHVVEPSLERQVQGFLAQESFHRREHAAFNDWLRAQGIEVDRFYAMITKLLSVDAPQFAELELLAVTCALEHFASILAEQWLTQPTLRERAHGNVRSLWTWHCLEELDHKSVAFDVYRAAGGSYLLRVRVMANATVKLLRTLALTQIRLMVHDRQFDPRVWLRGMWQCWGPRGYYFALLPSYLRYYKPNFHPWQKDDSALIARFERELGLTARGLELAEVDAS